MKKGDTVTLRCGDSSLRRKGSFSGLPMVKLPPGMATILSDADVPGIVSVKFLNSVTGVASVYISAAASVAVGRPAICPC